MALFQKRPDFGSNLSFSSYGMHRSLIVVGLGNPGKQYDKTRHNVGFMCVDSFREKNDMPDWMNKKDLKALVSVSTVGDTRVILCKPQTYMNNSGEAVQAIAQFYKVGPENIIVVHDELDVDFGQIRIRSGGSSAGHNGVKSIAQHVHEVFGRVRIGIGPKEPEQMDSADFVLQKFSPDQEEELPKMTREVVALLSEYAYGSPVTAETRRFL
jgi:peptidyl-tRNA hydrolase, PTH1 family